MSAQPTARAQPTTRMQPTHAQLLQAWATRRQPHWPPTLDATLADPLLGTIVQCQAVRTAVLEAKATAWARRLAAMAANPSPQPMPTTRPGMPGHAVPGLRTPEGMPTGGPRAPSSTHPLPPGVRQPPPGIDRKRAAAGDRDD